MSELHRKLEDANNKINHYKQYDEQIEQIHKKGRVVILSKQEHDELTNRISHYQSEEERLKSIVSEEKRRLEQ